MKHASTTRRHRPRRPVPNRNSHTTGPSSENTEIHSIGITILRRRHSPRLLIQTNRPVRTTATSPRIQPVPNLEMRVRPRENRVGRSVWPGFAPAGEAVDVGERGGGWRAQGGVVRDEEAVCGAFDGGLVAVLGGAFDGRYHGGVCSVVVV